MRRAAGGSWVVGLGGTAPNDTRSRECSRHAPICMATKVWEISVYECDILVSLFIALLEKCLTCKQNGTI